MLTFHWGCVSSSKTAELLVRVYAYSQHQHKRACLMKPAIDTRHGRNVVWSRVPGLQRDADLVIGPDDNIPQNIDADIVYVDEVNFMSGRQIEQLHALSTKIPVECYGLRTDFQGNLFVGSAALLACADVITHCSSAICHYCGALATQNLRVVNGQPSFTGPQIQLGCEELYLPVCSACFLEKKTA